MKKGILAVSIVLIVCIVIGVLLSSGLIGKVSGIVNAEDYGLIKNDINAAAKNTKALNRLIKSAVSSTKINFSNGTYYFAADYLGGIKINNKKNISLCGDNTVFVNTTFSPLDVKTTNYNKSNILHLSKSQDITISGITFDYAAHTNVCGEVIKSDNISTYFKVYDSFLAGENAAEGGETVTRVNIFSKDNAPINEVWFDEAVGKKLETTETKNVFKINGFKANKGEKVCAVFSSGTYSCPTIYVEHTSGLSFCNVTVNSSPSAVLYAPIGNADFSFDAFNVAPKSDENLFASNSDCIHIKSLGGNLSLKNCNFSFIGDDALNIHCIAAKITKKKSEDNSITLQLASAGISMPSGWASVGDEIEFFDFALNSIATAKVKKVKKDTLILDNIPQGVNAGAYVQNISKSPTVLVEDCTVDTGRARGILIQTKNVTVKNCTFKNLSLAGVLVAPDLTNWYELGPTDNLSIENCRFVNCNIRQPGADFGAITVALGHDGDAVKNSKFVHKNILIENNTFENCFANAVYATNVGGIKIQANQFNGHKVVLNKCEEIK